MRGPSEHNRNATSALADVAGRVAARGREWAAAFAPGAQARGGGTAPLPGWVGTFVRACRQDPKKAGVFAVLVVILGGMWVRMAVGDGPGARPGGSSARAAISPQSATGGILGPRRGSGVEAALSDWRATPILPPRNLFAVKFDYFPRDGSRPAEPVRGGEGFWAELEKSMSDSTDVRKQRQVLIENLQLQAARLRLETTVMSAAPKAVINGELVGEGDVVASGRGATRTVFRVSKIEPRRVIVEREGIKLEIPMR
jgi:hypothetical protein